MVNMCAICGQSPCDFRCPNYTEPEEVSEDYMDYLLDQEEEKSMNLYEDSEKYICHILKDRDEWKSMRIHGIGGSDASTLVNKNPYKDNNTLYKEKKGIMEVVEVDNDATRYGSAAEEHIRELFKLKHPELDVQYVDNCTLQSKECDWRLYSPDGLIVSDDKKGILEIKTSFIMNKNMWNEWKEGVPMHYYIQTLHGLLVTGFDFVIFCAELRFIWTDEVKIIERTFTREEALEDLQWLELAEKKGYQYYLDNIEPPIELSF